MKFITRIFLALFAASSLFAVSIPPTDITPLATATVIGRNTAGTGRAEVLTTLPNAVQDNITRVGTIATGTWNGTLLSGQYGGTGVANTSKTITLGGNLTTSGAFTTTFTVTGNTNVTLPTSGTLLTSSSAVSSTAGTSGQVLVNGGTVAATGAVTLSLASAVTGVNSVTAAGSSDLTLTANGGTVGANAVKVANTTVSSSPTTGAFQVAGGVGIGGDVNTGGNFTVGSGASEAQFNMLGNGTGSTGGASFNVRNSGVSIVSIGNQSNIIGGGYSAVPVIYFLGTNLRFYSATAGADAMTLGSSGDILCSGTILGKTLVVPDADGGAITASMSWTVQTNEGATGMATFTLPSAAANIQVTFLVQDADGITIDADAGDTIRIGASVTAAGATISSTTIGTSVTLVAINDTEWAAVSSVGTWTF